MRPAFVLVVSLASLVCASPPAAADPSAADRAREVATRGTEAAAHGDLRGAIVLFKQARVLDDRRDMALVLARAPIDEVVVGVTLDRPLGPNAVDAGRYLAERPDAFARHELHEAIASGIVLASAARQASWTSR